MTNEQLAKWVAEFDAWFIHQHTSAGIDRSLQQAHSWNGYLRRCQETEQAIKDARKQALKEAIAICNSVCSPYPTDQGDGYNEGALDCEKKIKGLLND